jgi:polyketide biosynthesis acyl carrier protein
MIGAHKRRAAKRTGPVRKDAAQARKSVAGGPQSAGTTMTNDDIFHLIGEHARQVLPGLERHRFERGDRLGELGATSMDRAEILMLTLESLSLSVPRTELAGSRNIGELAELLHARLTARE